MDNNTEEFVMKVFSDKDKKTLKVFATKADQWCFIRIGTAKDDVRHFFFNCSLQVEGKAFFRAMNDECPYPPVKPQPPVIEEICYRQVQKAKNFIDYSFEAYGKENSAGVVECYVKALKKTKSGDVETMCTKDAVIEGWEALSKTKLDDLIENADELITKDDGELEFKYDEKNTEEKFNEK